MPENVFDISTFLKCFLTLYIYKAHSMLIFLPNTYIIPGSVPGPLHVKTNSQRKSMRHICYCSVSQSCLTLCSSMNCSTPGFLILCYLQKFAQTHVHWVDAIQPSHLLSPPPPTPASPPAFNLSQHQGLFQWIGFLHQVAEVLEHQSFQWIFRADFLSNGHIIAPVYRRGFPWWLKW